MILLTVLSVLVGAVRPQTAAPAPQAAVYADKFATVNRIRLHTWIGAIGASPRSS